MVTTTQARHQYQQHTQTQQHMFEGDFSSIQVGQRVQISEVRMHKLQGRYPEVATYPEVDIKLLEHGDVDPMYLTLAVFVLDETSGNGLLYDETLINALETQMKTDAIGGLQGHLCLFNGGVYPVEEGYWVGHRRDERGITWAKAYIPPRCTQGTYPSQKSPGWHRRYLHLCAGCARSV